MKYFANIWIVMLILLVGGLASSSDLQVYHFTSSDIISFAEKKQEVVFSEANNSNLTSQIPLFVLDNDEEEEDDTQQHYTAIASHLTYHFTSTLQGIVLSQQKSFLHHITAYSTQKLFLLYESLKIAC